MSHCPRLSYMPIREVGLTEVIIAEEGRWLSPLTETVKLQPHSSSQQRSVEWMLQSRVKVTSPRAISISMSVVPFPTEEFNTMQ